MKPLLIAISTVLFAAALVMAQTRPQAAPPANSRSPQLFEHIASYGLHGIQVHYANGWFGKMDSKYRDDGISLGKVRLEAATGEDESPLVTIPKPDGMVQRSLQFVKWLVKENPEGNWGQYLTDDQSDLRWDKVIVSGISHGSTTAARFAKHQKVARVVMFSGPRDQFESWQGLPSATPANRYFGFTHSDTQNKESQPIHE